MVHKDVILECLHQIPTPSYICDEAQIEENAKILGRVKSKTGCKILLALKAFSMYRLFPVLRDYLSGITASSFNEAKMGYEEFKKEVHVYSPGYRDHEIESLLSISNAIVFNSFSQWVRYRDKVRDHPRQVDIGIRLNPEHSEVDVPIYDPCCDFSRLGVTREHFLSDQLEGVDGFHFHTLCGGTVEHLKRTLAVVEAKFGDFFHQVSWVNMGGGHHLTQPGYDIETLCDTIIAFQNKYNVQVILEPGEAVVQNAGVLVTSVVDIVKNKREIAIIDASIAAHMPDVLEMPYKPAIHGAHDQGHHAYSLGGTTCLAGDMISEYRFDKPLQVGQKLIIQDMAQYTMVKNTSFNGLDLPSIGLITKEGSYKLIKRFSYTDFKSRLS